MKFKFHLAIIICSMLLCTGCSVAKDKVKLSTNVNQMVNYAKNGDNYNSVTLFKQFNDKEKNELINFIEQNPGEIPPIFFVMLADTVYKTDKDKAVFFYNFGKVRAAEDVKMCKDTTAAQQIMMYSMIAPETIKYMQTKNKDYKYIDNLYNKIIVWDNKYTERISPIWSCYHGIQAFSQKPELRPAEDFPKIQKEMHDGLRTISESLKQFHEKNSK